MKTLCTIHVTGNLGGGTQSFIDINNMLKQTYHVIACVPVGSTELINILKKEEVEVYEYKSQVPVFSYYSGSASIFSFARVREWAAFINGNMFAKEILGLQPDVLVFNSVIMAVAGRFFPEGPTKICFIRETFKRKLADKILLKSLNKYFDGVCSIAGSELKYAKLEIKQKIIPDCYKVYNFSSENQCDIPIDKRQFRVLYLGGIEYIKGLDVLIKSIDLLPQDICLILAGYFDEKLLTYKEIRKLVLHPVILLSRLRLRFYYNKSSIKKRIYKTGYRKDVENLYSMADVVVFPSNKPHQLRPGIEAGYFRKPVILTAYKITEEYFINNYNALTFKPHNAKELAKCIQLFYNKKQIRDRIGENNYKMTMKYHHFKNIQNELIAFLKSIER